MSAARTAVPVVVPLEQRSHQRYPLQLEMQYKLLNRGTGRRSGSGSTLNISSGGVLFAAEESLPSGSPIELMLNWPFLLEGVCPLKLIMRGHIVRCEGNEVAIASRHHEFRTAGIRGAQSQSSPLRVRSQA